MDSLTHFLSKNIYNDVLCINISKVTALNVFQILIVSCALNLNNHKYKPGVSFVNHQQICSQWWSINEREKKSRTKMFSSCHHYFSIPRRFQRRHSVQQAGSQSVDDGQSEDGCQPTHGRNQPGHWIPCQRDVGAHTDAVCAGGYQSVSQFNTKLTGKILS